MKKNKPFLIATNILIISIVINIYQYKRYSESRAEQAILKDKVEKMEAVINLLSARQKEYKDPNTEVVEID